MAWGLGLLVIGIILLLLGALVIANDIGQYLTIIPGIIFAGIGCNICCTTNVCAVSTNENDLISSTPVEWVAEKNAFREVEVSNTILKVYPSRDWLTYKKDSERYTIIEKGIKVLDGVKYEKVIEHYNVKKTSDIFVKE